MISGSFAKNDLQLIEVEAQTQCVCALSAAQTQHLNISTDSTSVGDVERHTDLTSVRDVE